MSRKCELTGLGPVTGNLVSHSNIKTRTRWMPNVQKKKYLIPELSQIVRLTLSTRAIRTIDKVGGISQAIRQAKEETLSERLKAIKNSLRKASKAKAS